MEYFLNAAGALTWEYAWWNTRAPWLIIIFGYLPFSLVSLWVFDMKAMKKKIITVSTISAVDTLGLVLFAGILRWI